MKCDKPRFLNLFQTFYVASLWCPTDKVWTDEHAFIYPNGPE